MSFRDKERPVQAALADDLREYAVKRWPTANHKFRKARLADILGLTERRVRSFWEANRDMAPRDDEVAAIKALIGQKEQADAVADIALAKRIADLEAQVATLAAILARETLAAEGHPAHRASRGPSVERRQSQGRREFD